MLIISLVIIEVLMVVVAVNMLAGYPRLDLFATGDLSATGGGLASNFQMRAVKLRSNKNFSLQSTYPRMLMVNKSSFMVKKLLALKSDFIQIGEISLRIFSTLHQTTQNLFQDCLLRVKNFALTVFRLSQKQIIGFMKMTKTCVESTSRIYIKCKLKFNRKNKIARVFIFTEKYSLNFQNVMTR